MAKKQLSAQSYHQLLTILRREIVRGGRISLGLMVCMLFAALVSADEPAPSFDRSPYVHPLIIKDMSTWLSDGGDQVAAVNLTDSQDSNRYSGDIEVREAAETNPYVFCRTEYEGSRYEEFGYQYVGKTSDGIIVLSTSDSGGGSGNFKNLMLLRLEEDDGYGINEKDGTIHKDRKRLIVKKLGEMPLGDRWDGSLEVKGDKVVIGEDTGWFAQDGGK